MSLLQRGILLITITVSIVFGGISITKDNEKEFQFIWTRDSFDTRASNRGQSSVLNAAPSNTYVGKPGEADIPAYSFIIGVPQNGEIRISVTDVQTSSIQLSAPVRKVPREPYTENDISFKENDWLSTKTRQKFSRLNTESYTLRLFKETENPRSIKALEKATISIFFPQAPAYPTKTRRSDYEKMLSDVILNYNTALRWEKSLPPKSLGKKQAYTFPLTTDAKLYSFSVGDGLTGFNAGFTEENGIIKFTYSQMSSLFGSNPEFDHIALYAGYKGELPQEVSDSTLPLGYTKIPLLAIDKNNNGIFESNDYLLAWVSSNSDWHFSETVGWNFQLNQYTDYRTYWLVKRNTAVALMDTVAQEVLSNATVNDTLKSLTNRIFLKEYFGDNSQPNKNDLGTLDWIWKRITQNTQKATLYTLPIDKIDTTQTGKVIISSYKYLNSRDYGIILSGDTLSAQNFGNEWPIESWGTGKLEAYIKSTDSVEISNVIVEYPQSLDFTNETKMQIYSPPDSGVARYTISGLSDKGMVYLFRIPRNEEDVALLDKVNTANTDTYAWIDSTGIGISYFIVSENAFLPTPLISEYTREQYSMFDLSGSDYLISNLRETANRSDYLIITHPAFLSSATRLAHHKKSIGRFSHPAVVDIDAVYREFSGGNIDPSALRNFIFYAKKYWAQNDELAYVLLMGNGHWDYKRVLPTTTEPMFIPTAQTTGSSYQMCIEEYFVRLDQQEPQLFLGRIPCKSATEADAAITKIIETEDPAIADYGAWRNRMLLVADDDRQREGYDGIDHVGSSEKVGDTVEALRPSIDMRKEYLYEYQMNSIYQKPAAKEAVINAFNNGVAFANYFGHGAYYVWSDEHIFSNSDIVKLTNHKNYPIVTSFSCDVGKFDNPSDNSLGDKLVVEPRAGAIASIASTRHAWADRNENLAVSFYAYLSEPDSNRTIGQAYLKARLTHINREKLRAYALLGDPSIQFLNPTRAVTLNVTDTKGGTPIDTLKALQQITVRGTIKNEAGNAVDGSFGTSEEAFVQLNMFNPAYQTNRKDGFPDAVRYNLPGTPIFTALTAVDKGAFEQDILLPRNVAFNEPGVTLTAYVFQKSTSGLGYTKSLIFDGTVERKFSDSTGPLIAIRPVYEDASQTGAAAFVDKIALETPQEFEPAKFQIEVYDESGIDVVGTGPDEGLTVEIPGTLKKQNINNLFQFNKGEFRSGNATMVLEEGQINPGTYTLRVSAQDLLGYVSRNEITLEISEDEEFTLDHVFNYPNPMRLNDQTRFFFHPSQRRTEWQAVNIVLKIYSLSGKLLRIFRNPENGMYWNGTDQFSNLLGPNIYLYQFTARTTMESGAVEEIKSPIKKVVIKPPL